MFPMIAGRFRFVNCSFIFLPQTFFLLHFDSSKQKKKKLKNGYINLRQNEKRIGDEVVENVGRTNKFRSDLHDSLLPPLSLFRFRQQMFMIRNSGADEWHSTTNVYTRQPIKSSRHFSSSLHCRVVILITIIFSTNTPNFWKDCCCWCFIPPPLF
jgi:hypothetical protein